MPVSIPKERCRTIAIGARQLVYHVSFKCLRERMTYSAARVRDDILHPHIRLQIQRRVIHPINHIQAVLARRTDNHPLGPSRLDMHAGRLARQHLARALHDVLDARARPVDLGRVALREEVDHPALVEEPGGFGVVGCGRQETGVVGRAREEVARFGAGTVCRVVEDGGEEVLDRVGGVIYSADLEVGAREGKAEDGTAWMSDGEDVV